MDRKTVEIVIVALVAVAVVSVAASTLNSTAGPSQGRGLGGANGSGDALLPADSVNVSGTSFDVSPPRWLMIVLAVLGVIGALWYIWQNPLQTLGIMFVMIIVFTGLMLLAEILAELFGELRGDSGGGLLGEGISLLSDTVDSSDSTMFPAASIELFVVIVIGIVLVGSVLWLTKESSGRKSIEETDGTSDAAERRSIGRAAGVAADRIVGNAAVDNEVYRAWVTMTDLLDVPNPDTSTPADFAAAAVDAGMDREDVEELTALFRAVRYGPGEATPNREQRAVDALRRIESTYGPEDTA